MADLQRTYRWLRYVPDLGDNRELPKPFFLELTSGLTTVEMVEFHRRVSEWGKAKHETLEDFVEATFRLLEPHVRMGKEPLSLRGKPVPTLKDFVALGLEVLGESPVLELLRVVREYNELGGPKVLFFGPPSGGSTTTPSPSVEKDVGQTGGPSNGRQTNA